MGRKHFVSMSGTFRSFVQGKITLEELQSGHFLFGPHKESVGEANSAPVFVMSHNVEKPRWTHEAEYVEYSSLDKPVAEQWAKFKTVMREAHKEQRITWTDGKNYPAKIKPLLEAGDEVFWDEKWRTVSEFKYMADA